MKSTRLLVSAVLVCGCPQLFAQTITTVAGGAVPKAGPAKQVQLGPAFAVAQDLAGNTYIASTDNYIYKVDTSGNLAIIAGNGSASYTGDGGPATEATVAGPRGISVGPTGNIYIADTLNNVIRKISGGVITTVAGNGTQGNCASGVAATSCGLNHPEGVSVFIPGFSLDADILVADTGNNVIRSVSQDDGTISTVVGTGTAGFNGDGLGPLATLLDHPSGVSRDPVGNVYFTDTNNQRVREAILDRPQNQVLTLAGSGAVGLGAGSYTGDGGLAKSATLNQPTGLFFDPNSGIWVADRGNNVIRFFMGGGTINTVAGLSTGLAGYSGDGGAATSAALAGPCALFVDAAENVYIADTSNRRVRKVTSGTISTIAGNGVIGDGGPGTSALLASPRGVALDANGTLYLSDTGNSVVRATSGGSITTVVGNGFPGSQGDGGPATKAELHFPQGLAFSDLGAPGVPNLFIADTLNFSLRDFANGTLTTAEGTLGEPGSAGKVFGITGLASGMDEGGPTLYIADPTDQVAWVIEALLGFQLFAGTPGVAGSSAGLFDGPSDVANGGDIFVADTLNNRIVDASNGQVVAGNGTAGFSGDGGPATAAELNAPEGVAVDSAGNIYISDTGNSLIRKVDATTKKISTVAGNSSLSALLRPGFSGDGGPATSAQLSRPTKLAFDAGGNLYVADTGNNRIRFVGTPAPVLSLVPPNGGNLAVPDTQVGQTSMAPISLTNVGQASVMFTNITLAAATPNFSLTNLCGAQLLPGKQCTVQVNFHPMSVGQLSTTVVITDNVTGSPQMIGVQGNGTPAPTATVTVSPTTVAFGSVPVNTASMAIRVTLTNLAPKTLDFTSPVVITGPNTADFTIASTSCGMPVSGNGGVCRTMVVFTPSIEAPESASLNFAENGNPSTISAALTGTGVEAPPPVNVTVSPTTVTFGSVADGTSSAAIRVTLTNLAPKTLNFTSPVGITGPNAADFSIASTTCGMPVSGNGGVCRTMVIFTPSSIGAENASLTFAENGNPSMIGAALTGIGISAAATVTVSPTSAAFGDVAQGTHSAAIRVTLSNLAPKTLDFTSPVRIAGPNAADFSIASTTCGMPVSGNGGVCRTMVVFTPSKAGPESASLNFMENGNPSAISAALTGTGTGAPPITVAVSPAMVSFGDVPEGTPSAAIRVTLTNLAPKTLDFTSPVKITGPDAADFTISSTTCGMPVSGNGGVCRTMVVFTPSTTALESASLSFAENGNPSAISAALMGTGTVASAGTRK